MSEPRVGLFLVLMDETGMPVLVDSKGVAVTPCNARPVLSRRD